MLPRQKLSRRGQNLDQGPRRRRSRELAVEGLEPRTLLSFGDISTVAGDNNFGYTGNGGPATSAELNNPSGVAFDSAGDLFIADEYNQEIRGVVKSSGDIVTVAGDRAAAYVGGYRGDARCSPRAR